LKKAYDSVRREVFNNIQEFGVCLKREGLQNEMYNKVRIVKYLSDMFPVKNGLSIVFQLCFTIHHYECPSNSGGNISCCSLLIV
jgi:hypothetical protein